MAKYNYITQNNKGLKSFPKIHSREYHLKRKVSLKNNHIKDLPVSFSKLNSLEYLNLSNNKFTFIPKVFANAVKLQELHFDSNSIDELINITGISSLQVLNLSKNKIDFIPDEIVNLEKLQLLDLSYNNLQEFPLEFCRMKSLVSLDLSFNLVKNIPSDIISLINLKNLNLSSVGLNKFPKELKGLGNLKELHVDGNNFKLPPNYNPQTPTATINYYIKQEEFAKLKTTKAFVFKNISKKTIDDKYSSVFDKFTSEKGVDIHNIENVKDLTKDATVVFIIICFDIHENTNAVNDVISKCEKLNIRYYVLMQEDIIGGREFVNLIKGAEVSDQHAELKLLYQISYYKAYEELTNIIFNAVNQRIPNIKLNNIELVNIGHFENISIPISEKICCLVGENGTGKSTILKSIALACIGSDFDSINKNEIFKLLRIDKLDSEDNRRFYSGRIKLDYSVDGDQFCNEVFIEHNLIDNTFKVSKRGDFEISTEGHNLKSLIIGFPQLRGGISKDVNSIIKKLNQPHIDDILPLINNEESNRFSSFGKWIEQLFFDAMKKEYEKDSDIKEWGIIETVFEIISSFSEHEVSFKTVETGDPSVVWVKTNGAPNGIPIDLISQGFKVVMGWLGYFIQRLVESYPVQTPSEAINSHCVLLIDEIDTYIHPKWQAKLINILKKIFPNTQFILSTHSPIAISSCEEGEVVLLEMSGDDIILKEVHSTKGWSVENILLDIMGVDSIRDSEVSLKINRIEELFLRKYKDEIKDSEITELNTLIDEIDNLPKGDPIITLLNIRALGKL